MHRQLATANPAAFLPNLATSLNNLSNQQSNTRITAGAWEEAIVSLESHPHAQGELRSHYAEQLTSWGEKERALDQLVQATQDCSDGSPQLLRRARHRIRSTAMHLEVQDPRLPGWATDPLPDEVLDLLNRWAQATEWPSIEAFLRTYADRLLLPECRHHLHLATVLFPGDQRIENLTAVLVKVDRDSLDTFVDAERRGYDRNLLLQAWIDTPTWTESQAFLDEHRGELHTTEVEAILTELDDRVASQHLAVLHLTGQLTTEETYRIVTDRDRAAEHAHHAVENADIARLRDVVNAHPNLFNDNSGALFAVILTAAAGESEPAAQIARMIAEQATDIQRRATAIRLRELHQRLPDIGGLDELAALIHPENQP
jgi:hypothetical protein